MIPLIPLLVLLTYAAAPVTQESEGEFIGRVVVEWLSEEGADRTMRLVEEFAFRDPDGKVWEVPVGSEIDGASIPEALYSIIGPPFVGDYRLASVVHDHFCRERTEDWKAVHRMFYDGLLAGVVPALLAKTMYAAVHGWGPRWETRITRNGDAMVTSIPRPAADVAELQELGEWIVDTDATLEAIDWRVAELMAEGE